LLLIVIIVLTIEGWAVVKSAFKRILVVWKKRQGLTE